MDDAQEYDVVVVGGGMVGAAFVAQLAVSAPSLSVAVIDSQPFSEPPVAANNLDAVDPRVSAVTANSEKMMMEVGAWADIEGYRPGRFDTMSVWDGDGTASIDFSAAELGEHRLGHIVENGVLQWALAKAAMASVGVDWLAQCKLDYIHNDGSYWYVHTGDNRVLRAALLVGADGANSLVRQQANIGCVEKPYGHVGIVTTVQMGEAHQQCARQVFLPTGPLAFLPLNTAFATGKVCSIVWSAQPALAQKLMTMDDGEFSHQLTEALEVRLGTVEHISPRYQFPLVARHAQQYSVPGLALIGDAAHTIHPLAGQGVNLGFQDAVELAKQVSYAIELERSPGDVYFLRRYERERRIHSNVMLGSMKGFKWMFEQQAPAMRWARNQGMRWVNQLSPVKNHIMAEAMGLR